MRQKISLFCLLAGLLVACGSDRSPVRDQNTKLMEERIFDWQGHRGARGLLPENTVPAFLLALQYPKIMTLELDLAVSKDSQLIVSHEPWMSHHICSWPDGRPVEEADEENLLIHQLTAEEIRDFDCGSRGNGRFPEQQAMKTAKPRLEEVVAAADQRARELGRPLPLYNMEIKSRPEWDGAKTPDPATFARLVLRELDRLGIRDRTCIQSFDPRALEAVHGIDENVKLAFLVEDPGTVEGQLERLSFTPDIYSPYYVLVTANMVDLVHQRGMLLIPWTVNDAENMKALQELGVDGIITDYPDRIP